MHKGITTILLASTTALAACGGGGGGGGGGAVVPVSNVLDSAGLNSNIDSVSTSISNLESSIASIGSISSLVNPTESDKQLAGTALSSINTLESTWSVLQTAISNMDAQDRIRLLRSTDYHKAVAAYNFLTEKVKPLVVKISQGKGIDAMDAKDIATETAYNTYTVKKEQEAKTEYEAQAEDIAEENNLVINDDGSITPVVEEEVEEEPVVEEEEAPVEEEETVEEEEDTVEPIVEEPVEEESTPEEDTESEVEEESVEDETPVEPDETEEVVEEETPVEEEVVEEEVVEEETPVEEEETAPETEEVTVVEQTQYEDNLVYSHLDKTYLTPVVTVEDVVTYSGTWRVTTRKTTTTTPEVHEHWDKRDVYSRTVYSDGTEETELITTNYYSRGRVNKPGNTVVTEEEISRVNTDSGVIGDDHEDMGTRTPGYVADASHYEDDEYALVYNDQLSISNFSTAYSRGWTGNGSTVVIADTGALTTHVDLDDNIKHVNDLYGTGISMGSAHGTHVAGIAGAERNGLGMHGAAFDVDLAIAKVGEGSSYSFARARQAAAWGKTIDSVAINVSAETRLDTSMRNSIVDDGDGMYHSTHWYYGVNGYSGSVNEAVQWKTALGDEQVLVKAAGNAGTAYSSGMNQMAHATDANGNLILDGQMIIVGNWDANNNKINSGSNKAGTICATYSNGACQDAAKVKDFFIMADGTNVQSTSSNGGWTTMTGTSMAAPVVTGSIAILHQMWPHMKGKHLVQLVLVTANENIANYDENVHGHGLLDMDAATRPVGATGIPTTGRTDGGVSTVSGSVQTGSVANMTALTSVMVLDSFERDFYIDLGDMNQSIDTRTASVAEQMGAVDYFAGYLTQDQRVSVPIGNWTVGAGTEEGAYLGNRFEGTLGTTKSSTTVYANYNYKRNKFYAQAGVGVTHVDMENTGMLVSNDTVISSTATVGYNITDNWGVAVSQPVTVESAKMDYLVPTARTMDGNVVTEMRTVDWRNTEREIDLGTYYSFNVGPAQVDTFAELRTMGGLAKELERRIGAKLKLEF